MDKLVEQQREHFNEISEKYFEARKHPNHLLLKELIWEKFLKRNRYIGPEVKRVLEPMCGMAEGYEILSKNLIQNFDYQGFDYSENMVEIARNQNPLLKIEWNDVTTYQTSGDLFDLIILIGGLHHVYSRTQDILKNLRNSLLPGGYFLSFEPTHDNWLARRIRQRVYKSNDLFDDDTEQGFEYRDLDRYFKNAGYEKVDEVYPGLIAYIFYYNPDAFPMLNVGGKYIVKSLFAIDRLFWGNWIGRKLSFATMSLWRRI
ncbi:class I SAM-dependent methyltransferase [Methylicorpusculum oleiharenae]|uniref:class I SAM-dependent methyltransferase n=1 Tax=Methylicorpusculum oleiharenae TaxID=1338687 RepID=UPI001356D2FF|nr:class I SAM-dependent methyltransferase [Methylicorpusculum oleiharenae]MCD2450819.1 class I SAM-dependent methyltransferase [Methylicorpusculum oleiharenae]